MFFILALIGALAAGEEADLVVRGARIYTVDPNRPAASAIAVKGGRILAVGDSVEPHIGSRTRVIEARGRTLVPGFIDSHGHMEGLGLSLETLDLRHTSSAQEVAALVAKAAGATPRSEWIRGRSWDQTRWPDKAFPNAAILDRAAPDHPVYLTRVDGHAGWANSKALAIAGVTAATPDPSGGKIIRDNEGRPTGVLIDRAQGLVTHKIPPSTPEQIERRLERAARECARLGLTTVHDAGAGAQVIEAYRKLIAVGRLPVRIYAMIGGEGDLWRRYLERGPEIGERLTVRSIKLVADGALGSRGAALLAPYSDEPGNTGLEILTREDIERVARAALARGFQVNTHAIGDRANRTVLDAYAALLQGPNDRRFRIEHAQVIAPADFARFRQCSVVASMQATHATSDMRWAEARLGQERAAGAYAWQTLLRHGVRIANGSDFPVEDPNPLPGFYASITRQDAAGHPGGGWFPEQRMTREEALRSWTLEGAWAAFEESTKGSLTTGKLADFILLSHNIMEVPPSQILKARVVLTVLGGEIVHSELE